MAESNFEKQCFKTVLKVYSVFWNFPLEIGKKHIFLYFINPLQFKYIPFLFACFVTVLVFLFGSAVSLFYRYLSYIMDMKRVEVIILALVSSFFAVTAGCLYILISNTSRANSFISQLIKLALSVGKGKGKLDSKHLFYGCKYDFSFIRTILESKTEKTSGNKGNLLTIFVLFLGFSSTLVAPALFVVSDLDPFKYFVELWVSDPKYRSTRTIIFCFTIRIVCFELACVELHRFWLLAYCIGMVIVKRVLAITFFLRGSTKFNKFYHVQRLMFLMFRCIEDITKMLLYLLVTFFFWFCVVMVWIIVKCYNSSEVGLLYYFIVIILLISLLIGISTLSLACQVGEVSVTVVSNHRVKTKQIMIKGKTFGSHLDFYRAQALFPLRLQYGFVGFFGKGLICEVLNTMCVRCFEAIVLFDYK